MITIEYLEFIAFEFRKVLESVVDEKKYDRLTIFRDFPTECCRYTSDLLAEYMMSKGISRECICMVEGKTMGEGYTHCWLLINNTYYVDISADQFNGKGYFKKYDPIPSCCVIPRETKYFYECFDCRKLQYLYDIGIDSYSGDIPIKLQVVYDAVVKKIERNTKGEK